MMGRAGAMRHRVAFDVPVETPDGSGGRERGWSEMGAYWAELIYQRGREAVQAGAVTGTATFKLRVQADPVTRALTTACRLRDLDRDVALNIREVDAITDPAWVWIVAEGGVAV